MFQKTRNLLKENKSKKLSKYKEFLKKINVQPEGKSYHNFASLNLRKNLLNHFRARNKSYLKDSSTKLASILQRKKLNNLIFFNYVPQLDKFLYWNQQLIAESLGKKGKGFLPVVSSAPRDHHSLLQLYLDGPKDKLFYVFSSDTNNKSLNQVKKAQKNAFLKVLKKKRIPFREFKIGDINEQALGELFSYFILETIIDMLFYIF